MKVLLLDNYDSFTYNLAHYLEGLDAQVQVMRNDDPELLEQKDFSHLLISPGFGLPNQAGLSLAMIERHHQEKPILGVCLGFQAMAQFYGAELYNQQEVAHGIQREISCNKSSWLMAGCPAHFKVGLYHSWAVKSSATFQTAFRPVAWRDGKTLMAFEHRQLPLAGIQYHPESIMSEWGHQVLKNWLERGN